MEFKECDFPAHNWYVAHGDLCPRCLNEEQDDPYPPYVYFAFGLVVGSLFTSLFLFLVLSTI